MTKLDRLGELSDSIVKGVMSVEDGDKISAKVVEDFLSMFYVRDDFRVLSSFILHDYVRAACVDRVMEHQSAFLIPKNFDV